MFRFIRKTFHGFTLVEIMVAMAIVLSLILVGLVSLSSLSRKKYLQSEADNVKEDIYLMQSRAVTNLRTQRFVILTNTSYQLEEDTTGTGNWTITQQARSFSKPGIYFYNYTGKENKLWYLTSGLPAFNGASSDPFFSMVSETTTEKKDFKINASGVVNITSN